MRAQAIKAIIYKESDMQVECHALLEGAKLDGFTLTREGGGEIESSQCGG